MRTRAGRLPRLFPLIAAVLILFIAPIQSATAASEPAAGLLITEVSPYTSYEGVSVGNFSTAAVDLQGCSLTDGEGTLTFTASLVVPPGGRVTVVKTAGGNWFSSREDVHVYGADGIAKKGSFTLADSGDEVSLLRGGTVLDAVCYNVSPGTAGWSGDPAPLRSGQYLVRTGGTDTGTAADWTATKPGWTRLTYLGPDAFPAQVSPFAFPESGGAPVYTALAAATATVDISIYLLTCPDLVALLCELEQRSTGHVDVRVLLEGVPLGMDISTELALMKSLTDAGGEVRLIDPAGSGGGRYTYLHNKYAVIDGSTVVITSENWTAGNLGYGTGNRGWGAVIAGTGYAAYMAAVFANDFTEAYGDTKDLAEAYPELRAYAGDLTYRAPADYAVPTYAAAVTPILSPDDSYAALASVLAGASERLYVEQLDLGSTFRTPGSDTPLGWLQAAAARGVDARFILDASVSSSAEDHRTAVNLINTATGIKAITIAGGNGFTTVHNKGIIADGRVWLGSVNWTATSLQDNRETAVLIGSAEVAAFFTALYLTDWGVNIHTVEEDGLRLTASGTSFRSGETVVLRVVGPTAQQYRWSFGDGQIRETAVPAVAFRAPGPGTYTATVTAVGTDCTENVTYVVVAGGSGLWACLPYAAAAAVTGLGALAAALRGLPRPAARRSAIVYSRGRR